MPTQAFKCPLTSNLLDPIFIIFWLLQDKYLTHDYLFKKNCHSFLGQLWECFMDNGNIKERIMSTLKIILYKLVPHNQNKTSKITNLNHFLAFLPMKGWLCLLKLIFLQTLRGQKRIQILQELVQHKLTKAAKSLESRPMLSPRKKLKYFFQINF